MRMRQIFSAFINTVRVKFANILSRIKYWTNINLIRTILLTRLQQWLLRLFSIKPRHKKDYYSIFGLLVSRRLVHVIVISIGILSLFYLWIAKPFKKVDTAQKQLKTYAYNSAALKFVDADVNITAKRGYVAYTGHVKNGYVQGDGELYNAEGAMVYTGQFEKNKYNGKGKLFYPTGTLKYEGEFKDNLYQGTGQLYRESGVLRYSGEFDAGYMDGLGELYNTVGDIIYTGSFRRDRLVYTQLLNKKISDVNKMYTGTKRVYDYEDQDQYIVSLDEINALYVAEASDTSLTEDVRYSNMLYVMNDVFVLGDKQVRSISELRQSLGEPEYEGNAYINFYDAAAIKWGIDNGMDIEIDTGIEYSDEYDEYTSITSFNTSASIYMYVYELEGLSYTFISIGHRDSFFMYIISI